MKITKVECWKVVMDLKEPYTIAYNTYSTAANVFLRIETNKGVTGFGCAAPDFDVTGETADSVIKACREIIEPSIKGSDPLRMLLILHRLKKYLVEDPSAKAMLDMALYDIMGKQANLPLYKLLGGYRTHIVTSITIGIMSPEKTMAKAKKYIDQGFSAIKIKGGNDVEEDISKIILLRKVIGKKIAIRFDANQGYSSEEASHFILKTKSADLQLIEQPVHKDSHLELSEIKFSSHIPVMADESLLNLADSFRLAKKKIVDMLNIKLMKVGGIHEALLISAIAQVGRMEIMVGCMDNSALAISAGLHFSLSIPGVVYADLDGHLDLIDDPSDGAVILKHGVLYPTNRPGLGFDLH